MKKCDQLYLSLHINDEITVLYNWNSVRYNGEDVRLMIWDTAGQEEFDAITKAYYRGNILFAYFQ